MTCRHHSFLQAGKGRTGTVISCLMLARGLYQTAKGSIDHFQRRRMTAGKSGVEGPSQARSVCVSVKFFLSPFCMSRI